MPEDAAAMVEGMVRIPTYHQFAPDGTVPATCYIGFRCVIRSELRDRSARSPVGG